MKALESMMRTFVDQHPQDAARAFETLSAIDAVRVLESLPNGPAAALLERLSPTIIEPMLSKLESDRVRGMLTAMSPRAASAVLSQLGEESRQSVLSTLDESVARSLRDLASYSPDTAGAFMHPRVASLSPDLTIQQAITRMRKSQRDALHYLYVADRDGKLLGVVTMRSVLLAPPRDKLESILIRDLVTVSDTTPRDEVIAMFRERKFLSLPVVDFEGRLIGVVRRADVLEAGQLEGFENMQKIVGASADERALSPVLTVVKSRLPWLYVNLLTAFMAAAVVGLFEDTIAQLAALAVLLPIVAGQGGNTGAQSLAVVMRGLVLREIVPGVRKRVVLKEMTAGAVNGVGIALVTALCVLGWRLAAGETMSQGATLAMVIGVSMVINMVAAALFGALIPLALKALGRDPAQSASIFLTTVTDIVGFGSFLALAVTFKSLLV